jgi:hypothetical protein
VQPVAAASAARATIAIHPKPAFRIRCSLPSEKGNGGHAEGAAHSDPT